MQDYRGRAQRRTEGPVVLIDNYDSFTWNLAHRLWSFEISLEVIENDAITCDQLAQMDPLAILLSPGPGRPDRPSDFGICTPLLHDPRFAMKPLLGVCLGHQGLAVRFGGRVQRAPQVMHGKVSAVHHTGEGLFQGLSTPTMMMRYHSLLVERESISSALHIDAWTEEGLVMGLSHRQRPWFGVQFHPESVSSLEGTQLLGNFLTIARDAVADPP